MHKIYKINLCIISITFMLIKGLVAQQNTTNDILFPPTSTPPSIPSSSLTLPSDNIIRIPIVVHVIHDGGSENISEEQIVDAIKQLNEDFRGVNTGIDTEIEFFLATRDPNGLCTGGINRIESTLTIVPDPGVPENDLMLKSLIQWPNDKYLNVWVVKCIEGGADCSLATT